MRVAFLVPTVNTFGSVREMIEVSNVLVKRGHQVYIFHPDGTKPRWLPCSAHFAKLDVLRDANLDVLIGIIDWQPQLYELLLESKATLKAVCLMGFEPAEEFAAVLRGEAKPRDKADRMLRDAIEREFIILADGSWQCDWVRDNVGIEPGPAFGGINLKMFYPISGQFNMPPPWHIRYSGDMRERKGTDTVKEALEILGGAVMLHEERSMEFEADYYYGIHIDQDDLVAFLRDGDIFVDGHRRAGWCNPVIEAMACGNAIVCTDIGATRDFAIHEETALVVPVDEAGEMGYAIGRLMTEPDLRGRLVQNGLEKVKEFDYDIVTPRLEAYLEERLKCI